MSCSDTDPSLPISKKEFLEWRQPRRGNENPEKMTNPVWEWIVRNELNGFLANDKMGGPSSLDAGPCWSADRFGQSRTELPDGRVLQIAGEHEDHYDPDFFIYNDVIVHHPDGRLEIYGYDEKLFPPTDSHSATLVGDDIWMIGSLGYPDSRIVGETQVLKLDSKTLEVSIVKTNGDMPGWIHDQNAKIGVGGNSIVVSGGKIFDGEAIVENIDEWELNLESSAWKRLSRKTWPRWTFSRENGEMNELFEARLAEMKKEFGSKLFKEIDELSKREFDLTILEKLYAPEITHQKLPKGEIDEEHNVYRIEIDGVTVRYVEDSHQVALTVEGELPIDKVKVLVEDLTEKLSSLEEAKYTARNITNYP